MGRIVVFCVFFSFLEDRVIMHNLMAIEIVLDS